LHLPDNHTICALASPPGMGAIAIIRVSGNETFSILDRIFYFLKGKKNLLEAKSHTLHFGLIKDGDRIIDEVLVSIFRGPHSYTGEDTVEISCHGSPYIQQQILQLLIREGARTAQPGEFTLRAYLNKKLDLSQAEAVADLISSSSEASHQMALQQLRGGFSRELAVLREKLIHFASLIELELDFAEEDVEFADRSQLQKLIDEIQHNLYRLIDSFSVGNVIKNGIPVAIVGAPNVGKSTLLNVLLNEERAIVSEIAGTTRDVIEDEIIIKGISFRFIDTAGIRETVDTIESIGISKTFEKINQASIVIYLFDASNENAENVIENSNLIKAKIASGELILVGNKADRSDVENLKKLFADKDPIFISASNKWNIDKLTDKLYSFVNTGIIQSGQVVVTNVRHYEALKEASQSLSNVTSGVSSGITGDFLAIDIRRALHHLGEITGTISTDDLLENIFRNFCIGK
jgi:tRNA modification GTPase